MAGTLVISTLSDGTNSTSSTNCIQGSAKAWVKFTGSSGAINASYNVSSVTRSNTGRYFVNFTNAMADTNYVGVVTQQYSITGNMGFYQIYTTGLTTSVLPLEFSNTGNNTFVDPINVHCAVFR